jgi:hypothetical protein
MHYDLTLRKNCPDSSISENHLPLFRHIKRIFDQDLLMQVGLCDTTIDASYETSKRDSLTSLPGLPGWPPATCSPTSSLLDPSDTLLDPSDTLLDPSDALLDPRALIP